MIVGMPPSPDPSDLIEICQARALALLQHNLVPQGILAATRTPASEARRSNSAACGCGCSSPDPAKPRSCN